MAGNIRKIWYVSGTLTSNGPSSSTRLGKSGPGCPRAPLAFALGGLFFAGVLAVVGCAQPKPAVVTDPSRVGIALGPERDVATKTTVPLAGARCAGGTCQCREAGANEEETTPPAEGMKRLEVRMSADGGVAAADISGVGIVAVAGAPEVCAYIDLPAGSVHDIEYVAKETAKGQGVAPRMKIAEYGPKGPYWYDMMSITCDGPGGHCDRAAAEAWGAFVRDQRKRGRLDPCGSGVISKLAWDTSGSEAARDGGLFRDFGVRFSMELKKFATQSPPGSTECVPK